MGDGWTGINIDEVQKNLAEFEGAFTNAVLVFTNGFDTYNQELFGLWASPKAVEFNPHLEKLAKIKKSLSEVEGEILVSAGEAASLMASHNGATFANPYSASSYKGNDSYTPLREILHGITGMNLALASVASGEFEDVCKQVLNSLKNLPMNIALIDPDGLLVDTYKAKIAKETDKLSSAMTSLKNAMIDALNNETNEIKLGEAAAEAALAEEQLSLFGDRAYNRASHDVREFIGPNLGTLGILDPGSEYSNPDATLGEKIGAGIGLVGNTADLVVGGAVEAVQGLTDYTTYGLNWALDLGNASSSKEYWQNVGTDISENWNHLNNASNFFEGALGFLEGVGRTGVDTLVQIPINAVNTATDWLGTAIGDGIDWVGENLGNLWNSIF